MKTTDLRVLGLASYGVALVLIAFPLFDSVVSMWPLQVDSVAWRFGTVGLLSRAVMTPMLGMLLGLGTATLFEDKVAVDAFSVFSFVGALAALAALALFLVDSLEARTQVVASAVQAFYIAAAAAVFKYSFGCLIMTVLAYGGLRVRRGMVRRRVRSAAADDRPIVARAQ